MTTRDHQRIERGYTLTKMPLRVADPALRVTDQIPETGFDRSLHSPSITTQENSSC